ncbi:LytR/AlgR family response regulator transcription factor [Candidatus Stoquefichus massiliensis]|uniref:LytR/AlgR family response regulator transcription factor n=1 Tax=Candidatus Stoquefichus massiliensis TaxID=1470350 RepID=UPI000489539C|nr:LytTR family DNA-binding domain-containing protein [Candidatus Stoquefichus massiliensis]
MFKFAIIDNHQSDIDRMIEKIHQLYFNKHNIVYKCDSYLGCKDFPYNIYYDAIFLDIEMPEISGFEFAEKINKEYNSKIIFMTNHRTLVLSTFDYQPFQFIQKDNFDNSATHALEFLYNKLFNKALKVYINEHEDYITQGKITYIHIENSIVNIYSFDKVYTSWESITSIYEHLNTNIFVRINQSTIINMEYIKEIDPSFTQLVLKNNSVFKISERNRSNFKKLYRNFRLG